MKAFSYHCPRCGLIDMDVADDSIQCRCGAMAKRRYQVAFNRSSTKPQGRWDPQVGQYVENERQFQYLLKQGAEAESEKLNMEVKLETVDSRDTDALTSLRGMSEEDRLADLNDMSDRVKFEAAK